MLALVYGLVSVVCAWILAQGFANGRAMMEPWIAGMCAAFTVGFGLACILTALNTAIITIINELKKN